MKFSILIPTHRYDCSALVRSLKAQAEALQRSYPGMGDWEILVCPDGEEMPMSDYGGARIVRQPVLSGPAASRNHLVRASHGEYLLFIDADAEVVTDDFLLRYAEDCDRADVVCGALRNPDGPPREGHELRMRYERKAEGRRTATWRNAHPYDSFSTFNFMARRQVAESLPFDERSQRYGYEDSLFGLQLQAYGFSILHTDNALVHTGIDSNESFLAKTEEALRSLRRLGEPLQSSVGASRVGRSLGRWGLLPLLRFVFSHTRGMVRRNLLGRRPSLFLFAFYKLGYYACLKDEKTQTDAVSSPD